MRRLWLREASSDSVLFILLLSPHGSAYATNLPTHPTAAPLPGYSALLIAQSLPPSGRLISIERDLTWVLTAKRFMWQASQGSSQRSNTPVGDKVWP